MSKEKFVLEKIFKVTVIDENGRVESTKDDPTNVGMLPSDEEEISCSGCVYEDADGSTAAISNCVCCSRNVEFAKNDYYKKK